MIKLIRVDYRLLHGQVALNWTQMLGADALLLVSDTVLNDPVRIQALKLARPDGVKVVLKNSEDAVQVLLSGVTDKYNLFVVCETLAIAYQVAKAMGIKAINLGNIAFEEGKKQISKSIYLNNHDEALLRSMVKDGYDCFIQMIPSEKRISANSALKGV